MLHNELLRVVRAHLLGFPTGITLPRKRFCLFCLFHTSLSVAACLVQPVYTNFPNRVNLSRPPPIYRPLMAVQISPLIC